MFRVGIRLFRRSGGRRGRRRVVLVLCAQGRRREPQNEGNQEREANTAVSHLLLSVLRTRRTAHSIPMQEPIAETRSSRVAGEDLEPKNRPAWRRAGEERRPLAGRGARRSRRGESGVGRGRKRERRGGGDDQGGSRRKPYGILAVRRSAGVWGRRAAAGVLLAVSLRRRGPGSAFELAEAAERRQRREKNRSECRSRCGYRSFHSSPCM